MTSTILRELGIEVWKVRDQQVFKGFRFPELPCFSRLEHQQKDFPAARGRLVVVLPAPVANLALADNFFQAMFGSFDEVIYLYRDPYGSDFTAWMTGLKPEKVISLDDIQKVTSNSSQDVLILNNMDFELLRSSSTYKKQVMLDVKRVSVSSVGTK